MPASKALEAYRRKRDFSKTLNPRAAPSAKQPSRKFCVSSCRSIRGQHYDFRLELDGVLKSWAIAKGPSLVPGDKRLAVHVEDHPLEYERAGRIFVDYLRNGRGSTAVAAYSARARPEAGVAMPLDWGELDVIGNADHFALANAGRRLNGLGCESWQAINTTKQRLPAKRSRAPRRSV
jgi:hypothetical protein